MNSLVKKGINEFEKMYPFIKLTESDKSILALAYTLGYANSKIDTYSKVKSK
jgi:predicted DNA binding protein